MDARSKIVGVSMPHFSLRVLVVPSQKCEAAKIRLSSYFKPVPDN